ncbi:MAG: ornithine cyclodeaminase family protein [Nitrososphaerota archaeon]
MTDWQHMKTLIVSGDEMKGLVSMDEVISLVEQAYAAHARGLCIMEPKTHIIIEKYSGEWEAMPSYLGEPESSACKWVAIRERNRERFGLPTVMSTIVYTDPETGYPLMICDGTYHTNMRTGAAAAVSVKWMARRDSKVAGFVGSGAVAVGTLRALNSLNMFTKVLVWSRRRENAESFVKRMQAEVSMELAVANSVHDVVADSDVVVTQTPAIEPVVKDEWVREGTHIAAMGADMEGKQELEGKLLKRSRIFVDDLRQCIRDGEINVPLRKGEIRVEDVAGTIGEIIIGRKRGRLSQADITVFDSTGIALQDAAVITLEYKRARERGVGVEKRMIVSQT